MPGATSNTYHDILKQVVWNLTATEYYDWIGVVDGDTGETILKVSINSLVAWHNPVGAHCWTETLSTTSKVRAET